ncbi:MAG: HepT-like ribonuclease domain-containing protein [Planctomycetota bacterium]|jgi:uncharacterized protein with HEPN domain
MPPDEVRLRHMVDAAQDAISFARGRSRSDLDGDRQFVLALVQCVQMVGEAAGRVSEETRSRLPDLPWAAIVGMRNRLVHGYYDIDHDEVWNTVANDLPPLVEALTRALEDH